MVTGLAGTRLPLGSDAVLVVRTRRARVPCSAVLGARTQAPALRPAAAPLLSLLVDGGSRQLVTGGADGQVGARPHTPGDGGRGGLRCPHLPAVAPHLGCVTLGARGRHHLCVGALRPRAARVSAPSVLQTVTTLSQSTDPAPFSEVAADVTGKVVSGVAGLLPLPVPLTPAGVSGLLPQEVTRLTPAVSPTAGLGPDTVCLARRQVPQAWGAVHEAAPLQTWWHLVGPRVTHHLCPTWLQMRGSPRTQGHTGSAGASRADGCAVREGRLVRTHMGRGWVALRAHGAGCHPRAGDVSTSRKLPEPHALGLGFCGGSLRQAG